MTNNLRLVKGCKDLYSDEILKFRAIIDCFVSLAKLYGCNEFYTPIIEHAEVFEKSLGQSSDVVSKEMYSFVDQGGERLTLRPEFTAGVMRAFLSGGMQHQVPLRLFSYGPLFRRERPQAGRQRQFHQINVEFLGADKPFHDAELIKLGADILNALQVGQYFLEVNSLGCSQSRKVYRDVLYQYFSEHNSSLSEVSKTRLQKNPLRILDSKEDQDQKIIANAPLISQYYTQESKEYFDQVLEYLKQMNVAYKVNEKIVRGLDYYNHTAFEFISSSLGAQSTILAGGRYDGLAQMMGSSHIVPAVGFAGGIERLMMLSSSTYQKLAPVVVIPISVDQQLHVLKIIDSLRQAGVAALLESGKKLGDVIQKALNKHSAKYVIIIGEDEVKNDTCVLKDLIASSQQNLPLGTVLNKLENEAKG